MCVQVGKTCVSVMRVYYTLVHPRTGFLPLVSLEMDNMFSEGFSVLSPTYYNHIRHRPTFNLANQILRTLSPLRFIILEKEAPKKHIELLKLFWKPKNELPT